MTDSMIADVNIKITGTKRILDLAEIVESMGKKSEAHTLKKAAKSGEAEITIEKLSLDHVRELELFASSHSFSAWVPLFQ